MITLKIWIDGYFSWTYVYLNHFTIIWYYWLNIKWKGRQNNYCEIDTVVFVKSYLTCDARSYPQKLKSSMGTEDSLERLSVLCEAWPRKRRCSVRLSSKLNDCLGSQLEDGRAGTNALSLADAHMKFICHHKNEYISKWHNLSWRTLYIQLSCF